jgi:hypothetical protein
MEVNVAPDLQAEIDRLTSETGCAPDKLIEDALAGYISELAHTRKMLADRYDELKTGVASLIPGEQVVNHFREKSAAARRTPPGS